MSLLTETDATNILNHSEEREWRERDGEVGGGIDGEGRQCNREGGV